MMGKPPSTPPSFSPFPRVLFVITFLIPATPQSIPRLTGAAQLSVAHADAATCATTAALGAADFLAVALAVDPAALMLARAQNGRRSVRC